MNVAPGITMSTVNEPSADMIAWAAASVSLPGGNDTNRWKPWLSFDSESGTYR